MSLKLICAGCKNPPEQIPEMVSFAKMEKCTPREFVLKNEGTLNTVTRKFLCTACYIKKGEPLGVVGCEDAVEKCFDGSPCSEAHQDCNICKHMN